MANLPAQVQPAWPGAQELNPITVLVQSSDRPAPEAYEMMFIMPTKEN